jgi:hypothetical protein
MEADMGPPLSLCPECGEPGRKVFVVFNSPESRGHHMYPARTPVHLRKPRKESEDRAIWQARKEQGISQHRT